MKCAWIEEQRDLFPVAAMCEVLGVSRSGFYAWQKRPESAQAQRRATLECAIRAVHGERRKDAYGSPRMVRELNARQIPCCENTVAKVMREAGIRAKSCRKFRATTNSRHGRPVAANVLDRQFAVTRANAVWVSDITYVWTDEGWLYLSAVEDLYTRKIVGWSLSERMSSELVLEALEMAIGRELPEVGLLAHSDRGSQYASEAYQELLRSHGITCSMSRKGNCWDNAPMESFFATLKKELVHQERYPTRAAARRSMFEYIEVFYNRERRHSALGYVSPAQFEEAA